MNITHHVLRRRLACCHQSQMRRALSVDIVGNYKQDVVNGKLKYDENQYKMLNLFSKLMKYVHAADNQSIDGDLKEQLAESAAANSKVPVANHRLRGIYLYGEVGTGKTMVMDIFHDACEIKQKKRIHFHDFMLEVHRRIHGHKQILLESKSKMTLFKNFFSSDKSATTVETDPIKFVAQEINKEARILCFDEFQVTDICDAMILNKLFHELWERNTILIATSNRPPKDLYKNGLNREYFVPFINRLNAECIVKDMNIKVDYRQKMTIVKPAYLIPNSQDNRRLLWDKFVSDVIANRVLDRQAEQAASAAPGAPAAASEPVPSSSAAKSQNAFSSAESVTIPVMMGRTLTIPHGYLSPAARAAVEAGSAPPAAARGVAWMDFSALCETEVGAADYIALCSHFHSLYIFGIPRLSVIGHNEARRFITLFDELYNANVRVQWTADTVPSDIFTEQQAPAGAVAGGTMKYNREAAGDDKASPKEAAAAPSGAGAVEAGVKLAKEVSESGLKKYSRNNDQPKMTMTVESPNGQKEDMKVLESELTSIQDLRFAFKRAASRLNEMSSTEYFDKWRTKYSVRTVDGDEDGQR